MPALPPRKSRRVRYAALGFVLFASTADGCKHSGGNSSDRPSTGSSRGDPLLGMRLPAQDVPVGGKPELARNGRDPLMTYPNAPGAESPRENNSPKQASTAAPGEVSSLPPRNRSVEPRRSVAAPYRPGLEASVAALAGGPRDSGGPAESDYDKAARWLREANATWKTPIRTKTGYSATATRSQSLSQIGPVRQYLGTGDTAAAALLSLAEQVRDDAR